MKMFITKSQKTCSKCQTAKPIDEFNSRNRKNNIRHSYCRDCGKAFTQTHYRENKRQYLDRNLRAYTKRREFVREVKSRPCADCGIQYPYYVMDFDHRNGEEKKCELNRVNQITMRSLKLEIEKCDVVCSNCHRERTFQRRTMATKVLVSFSKIDFPSALEQCANEFTTV